MKKRKCVVMLVAAVVMLTTGCSDFFQGKISMDNTKNTGTLEDLLTPAREVTELAAPQQMFVSKSMYAGKIAVSWSKVENATSYRIERAVAVPDSEGKITVPEESDYESLQKFVYSTTYTDTIIQNPSYSNKEYSNVYFYRVCAENIAKGLESPYLACSDTEGADGAGKLFGVPSGVEADKGKSTESINVKWNAVEGAVSYVIYRGTNADGTGMEKIGEVLGSVQKFSNSISESDQGREFFYKVCAQNYYGNVSAFSSIGMGYSLKEGAPAAPSGVCIDNGLGTSVSSVTIKWEEVAGTEKTTISYNLYRTSSEDSSYTLVKKITDAAATTYTDRSIKPGLIYWYYVQAVSTPSDGTEGEVLKSPFSSSGADSESPAKAYLLSAPENVGVDESEDSTSLILSWDAALGSEDNSYVYNIYASDSLNGEYALISSGIIGTSSEVKKHNFYKVSTVNAFGVDTESALSEAAAPVPHAPAAAEGSRTANLSAEAAAVWTANANGVYPVRVSWTKPAADSPAGYLVYRSTKKDSGFRKLTETPVTDLSYIDSNETARAGSYYYYRVVSVNELGQGKNYADTDGYGALTADQWFREYNKTVRNSQGKLTYMHKPNDMEKLGTETVNGDIKGTLYYNAKVAGMGAYITMKYENYADFYIMGEKDLGEYFICTGNTDTTSNMSANGNMLGTVVCTGMYPGSVKYDGLLIKGGAAGGGAYAVTTKDMSGNVIIPETNVDWQVGEEK